MPNLALDTNVFLTISHALDIFRRLDPNMPLIRMEIFLLVATKNGSISIRDLQIELNLTDAGVSRNVAALTAAGYQGKPGLGLLETYPDLNKRNRKIVQLSPNGKKLANLLSRLGQAESPEKAAAILAGVPEHNLPRSRKPSR
jgi:DNA-binding MarR family transcriptional regulator